MPQTLAEVIPLADSDTERLELVADLSAAAQARAWLRARLSDWSAEGIEAVQLLVSELVTNAVLHTNDPVEVTAMRSGSGVTVEVSDRNPSKPVVKSYGRDAATGRGLRLVEALADEWGVRGDETQKAVWFRVVDGSPSRPARLGVADIAGPLPIDGWHGHDVVPASAPPSPAGGQDIEVCLRELPVGTYLAAEEHHDALMREFALLLGGGAAGQVGVPQRLMELVAGLVEQFGTGNDQRRAQVEAARRSGRRTVDVAMLFRAGAQAAVIAVADQLDEVDEFCERGQLLTPASTPAVKQFRRWYTDEVVGQLNGQSARPWPYLSP